jgi:hypothetical protein
MKTWAGRYLINFCYHMGLSYVSYSIMRDDHAHMNDNIERTNENSRNPSQRGDINKNQRVIISIEINTAWSGAIMEPNIEGDPTRCDQ